MGVYLISVHVTGVHLTVLGGQSRAGQIEVSLNEDIKSKEERKMKQRQVQNTTQCAPRPHRQAPSSPVFVTPRTRLRLALMESKSMERMAIWWTNSRKIPATNVQMAMAAALRTSHVSALKWRKRWSMLWVRTGLASDYTPSVRFKE